MTEPRSSGCQFSDLAANFNTRPNDFRREYLARLLVRQIISISSIEASENTLVRGTGETPPSWLSMIEPLPILVESAVQIAWDFLERTGDLGEPRAASKFLLNSVEDMIRGGERRKLLLSNKAIDAYKIYNSRAALVVL